MSNQSNVYTSAHHLALGKMVDVVAAVGGEHFSAIGSVIAANAAMAAVLEEIVSTPTWWTPERIENLILTIRGGDAYAPRPATGLSIAEQQAATLRENQLHALASDTQPGRVLDPNRRSGGHA